MSSYTHFSVFLLVFWLPVTIFGKVTKLPNVLYNGSVTDETVSGSGSLDGVKLSSTSNDTTYEWYSNQSLGTS